MSIAPEYLHLVHQGPFYAYLYGRASHDPTKKGRSVASQLSEGRELCTRFDWPVVGVFDKDVDRSASRHAKRARDDFESMLEGIRKGECRIVVAWEASRYYRDLEAYVRLRSACQAGGVLLCYNSVIYDLSKREDIKATARDALDAEDEGEGIRDRNLRTQRRLVSSGQPTGRIPWGFARRYDPDTGDLIEQTAHPVRAPFVVEMFQRFTSGQTSYAIAKWLNGQPAAATTTGGPWDQERVVLQLKCLAYIGHRVHHGVDTGRAQWEPIVDEEVFRHAQRILAAPGRRVQRDTSVRHLLSCMALCGEHPEAPSPVITGKRNGRLTNFCRDRGDTAIRADVMEAWVEEAVIGWLASDAAVAAFRRDDADAEVQAARNRLASLTDQLDEARAMAARFDKQGKPGLSLASLAAMEDQLTPQIEAAAQAAREAAASMSPLLQRLVGRPDAEAVWGDLLLPQKRTVLRDVVTIRLHRAHLKGSSKMMPGRITLSFVGQPGFTGGSGRGSAARPPVWLASETE